MGRFVSSRARRPGVVAWRIPRHSSSSRNPTSPGCVEAAVTGARPSHPRDGDRRVSGPVQSIGRSSPAWYLSAAMQTSLVRRQRHRRLGDKRRPRGNGAISIVAVALPLLLFVALLVLGAGGALASVAGYTYLAKDLEDPKEALGKLDFTSQSVVFDRSNKVQLAKL